MVSGEAFVVTFGTTKMPVSSVHNWDILHMVYNNNIITAKGFNTFLNLVQSMLLDFDKRSRCVCKLKARF